MAKNVKIELTADELKLIRDTCPNDFMNLIPAYQEYVKWHNLNKNTNYKVPFK